MPGGGSQEGLNREGRGARLRQSAVQRKLERRFRDLRDQNGSYETGGVVLEAGLEPARFLRSTGF